MRKLYHYPLCAFGRLIRIYLKEKKLDYESVIDYPWDKSNKFPQINIFSDFPMLIDSDGTALKGWYAIIEHLEQHHKTSSLLGTTQKEKAESRRIMLMFNEMFFMNVTKNIVFEKVIKRHMDSFPPDSTNIRKGNSNVKQYFDYIKYLADSRNWLAGEEFSLADISAASQISCIDYIGSIKWDDYPFIKDWYVRIKSRPSFRDILLDKIPNFNPPDYYRELDFLKNI